MRPLADCLWVGWQTTSCQWRLFMFIWAKAKMHWFKLLMKRNKQLLVIRNSLSNRVRLACECIWNGIRMNWLIQDCNEPSKLLQSSISHRPSKLNTTRQNDGHLPPVCVAENRRPFDTNQWAQSCIEEETIALLPTGIVQRGWHIAAKCLWELCAAAGQRLVIRRKCGPGSEHIAESIFNEFGATHGRIERHSAAEATEKGYK